MVRGYAGGRLWFSEPADVDESKLDGLLPELAEKHVRLLPPLHMIEIEFLDEPNQLERFFRFGTDPDAMVIPIAISLDGGGSVS